MAVGGGRSPESFAWESHLDNGALAGRFASMNRSFIEIAKVALTLPQSEQLRLARTLLERAEASGDIGAEAAWEDEIERRIHKIDAGLAHGRLFADVLQEIDRRLGR